MHQLSEPIYFRIAPELRRCAIYVMVGFPLIGAIFFAFLLTFGFYFDIAEELSLGPGWAVFLVPAVFMLLPLRWRLRVDQHGIARRRLIGWDLWEWSSFASGRIRKAGPVLLDPMRPWWRRGLQLGFLTEPERKHIVNLINSHYRLPPPPEVGEALCIQHALIQVAWLDTEGIRLAVKRMSLLKCATICRFYPWQDVQRVHITRLDALRRDFVNLEVVLPDEELRWGRGSAWGGASAEEMNELLFRHVPAERIEVDIAGERPARRSDLERTLEKLVNHARQFRIMYCTFSAIIGALVISLAILNGVWSALAIAVLFGSTFGSICWFMQRDLCRRIERLRQELAAYGEGETLSTSKPLQPAL
jgi:hypothetical protein